jgi:hypothetical protein
VTLSKNGNGPVATAYRTQKPTLAGDASGIGGGGEACEFGIAQMKRADLAKEFGIQAIRFEPVEGGVIEIGRAPQLFQAEAKSFLVSPAAEFFSITASLVLLVIFAIDPPLDSMLYQVEDILTAYFCFEYILRWWAAGTLRYGATPLMLIDLLNVLPFVLCKTVGVQVLEGSAGVFGSLRALRILRLRKFLEREELTRLVRTATGDPAITVPEVQRAVARAAFSALAIVLVSAGVLWNLERFVNPSFAKYTDALYFSARLT